MSRRITCAHCTRYLAEVRGPTLYLYCPKCRSQHAISLTDLIGDLERWLGSVRQDAASNQLLEQLHERYDPTDGSA